MKDYYYILGVDKDSTQEDIKLAHRKLSLKFHPDKNEDDTFFAARFKEVQEAYDTLSDPNKRAVYEDSFAESSVTVDPEMYEKDIKSFRSRLTYIIGGGVAILLLMGFWLFSLSPSKKSSQTLAKAQEEVSQEVETEEGYDYGDEEYEAEEERDRYTSSHSRKKRRVRKPSRLAKQEKPAEAMDNAFWSLVKPKQTEGYVNNIFFRKFPQQGAEAQATIDVEEARKAQEAKDARTEKIYASVDLPAMDKYMEGYRSATKVDTLAKKKETPALPVESIVKDKPRDTPKEVIPSRMPLDSSKTGGNYSKDI